MNYTKEQIEKMADEYANQFMDGKDHFYGFKAGFEKALSLFAVSGQSEQLSCETCIFNTHSWSDDYPCATCCNFDKHKAT